MHAVRKNKRPVLRFPGFSSSWDEKKAGYYFSNRRERGEEGLPIYSVTLDRGLVRRDTLARQMGPDAPDEINLRAQPGDLVYNMMRMWQGAVGLAPEECMVSPAYIVLAAKPHTCAKYFDQWFKSAKAIYRLWAYSHGLTSDRLRLYYDDFAQIPLFAPSITEQEKIAAFLEVVDNKIAALKNMRDLLTAYKRGAMQKLFSQRTRFRRDDGSKFPKWENKPLGKVVEFFKGRGVSKADINPQGTTPCIRYAELYTTYGEVIHSTKSFTNEPVSELFLSKPDDVVIPASGESPTEIGAASCVKQAGIALGSDLNVLRSSINGEYLARYLRNAKAQEIARLAQGNSIVHLYPSQLAELKIAVPHPDEQKKIADFLLALDRKIDSSVQQLDQMSAFKRALLQQMFA